MENRGIAGFTDREMEDAQALCWSALGGVRRAGFVHSLASGRR
jgi:hypothetical protein